MNRYPQRIQTLTLSEPDVGAASRSLPDAAEDLERLDELARQLHRHGLPAVGGDIGAIATALRMDLRPYLTWMSEAEAADYTGHATAWLRARFQEMEAAGQARARKGTREYRQIALLAKRQDLARAKACAAVAARLGRERWEAA